MSEVVLPQDRIAPCPFCKTNLRAARLGVQSCPKCRNPLLPLIADGSERLERWLPSQVGRWVLVRPVRRGGMGIVLEGSDMVDRRRVAVKFPAFDRAMSEDDAVRFEREISLLEALDHPNLVKVLGHGTAGEQRFYAMEWVEGEDLEQVLKECKKRGGLLPFDLVIGWFRQLCDALGALHARGIVHRDVKPSNVIVGADQRIRLIDLGIAKVLSGATTKATTVGTLGTWQYLAPELLDGVGAVDGRADIYSLGVMTYELLTGTLPRGSVRNPSRLNSTIPEWFDTVLLKMMEQRPEDRLDSNKAMQVMQSTNPSIAIPESCASTNTDDGKTLRQASDQRASDFCRPEASDRALQRSQVDPVNRTSKNSAPTPGDKPNQRTNVFQWWLLLILIAIVLPYVYYSFQSGGRSSNKKIELSQTGGVGDRPPIIGGRPTDKEIELSQSSDASKDIRLLQSDRWNVANPRLPILQHDASLTAVACHPAAAIVATACRDGSLAFWNVSTGQRVHQFKAHQDRINSLAFSPDGKCSGSSGEDSSIHLWSLTTGEKLRSYVGPSKAVNGIAFSRDGKRLAGASEDGHLFVWDVGFHHPINSWHAHVRPANAIAFSPDGVHIASVGDDRMVSVWNFHNGQRIASWEGHNGLVTCLSFTPDGRQIISASTDRSLKAWDWQHKRQIRSFLGHADYVRSIAISPNGRLVASGSDDQAVKLWSTDTGQELHTFAGHTDWVTCVQFTPDGKWIISGSRDKSVRFWNTGNF